MVLTYTFTTTQYICMLTTHSMYSCYTSFDTLSQFGLESYTGQLSALHICGICTTIVGTLKEEWRSAIVPGRVYTAW